MQRVVETLEKLRSWVEIAISEQPKGLPGRALMDHAREAAFQLLEIWKEHAPEPTLRDFRDVVRAVTLPMYERYKLAPDLGGVCRQVLYEGWSPERSEDK